MGIESEPKFISFIKQILCNGRTHIGNELFVFSFKAISANNYLK